MIDDYDVDAYAVLNWLVRYYERRGCYERAGEIREEMDRLAERLKRSPDMELVEFNDGR